MAFCRSVSLLIIGVALAASVFAKAQPVSKDLGAIWFIGDSITQSNVDNDPKGSPRKSLYDLLRKHGYAFSFTGHYKANQDGLPDTGNSAKTNLYHYHSGMSGYVIGEKGRPANSIAYNLDAYWQSGRLAEVKPDIILIMIGTNDVGRQLRLNEAPERLSRLIEHIYDLPDIGEPELFIASIPPIRRNATTIKNVAEYNKAMPDVVESFKAQGRLIHYVDQFGPLDKDYAEVMRSDDLHPIAKGNDLIGLQWFRAIEAARGI